MTDILVLERARRALQKHHDWHLAQTDEVILCGGESIVPSREYEESSMCDDTLVALDQIESEIQRRTGINGA